MKKALASASAFSAISIHCADRRYTLCGRYWPAGAEAGRRAPVTAREVQAAAGTSTLGVGVGPYGGCGNGFVTAASFT